MASFLNNSGDIILDAVITDYGRKLLARGDGSFNIAKFGFADDEVDYTQYVGTAQEGARDTIIMQTPILEAITNNAASMKSPLLTLTLENILFMISMKLNTNKPYSKFSSGGEGFDNFDGFIVPVNDTNNVDNLTTTRLKNGTSDRDGVLNVGANQIRVDNGIDSDKLSNKQSITDLYPMMRETQFNIYVDNKFSSLGVYNGAVTAPLQPVSIDDDNIAVYRVTDQTVLNNMSIWSEISTSDTEVTPIKGTRGTRLTFTLVPNADLISVNTFFDKYGKVRTFSSNNYRTIKSSITVEGIATGCSVEIPVMFVKYKSP